MITNSMIAVGDQLGAQLSTLAALMHIGIINNQEIVFWEEMKSFKRGFQFLDVFDIDGLRLLRRCRKFETKMIDAYCGRYRHIGNWKKQMNRIYGKTIYQKLDRLAYEQVKKHYQDFRVIADLQNGVITDKKLLSLQTGNNYDIWNGFGIYSDWGKNADRIIGRFHFKKTIVDYGEKLLSDLYCGEKERVAVHLRRTDYLVMSSLNLKDDYYNKAMSYFNPSKTRFIVFSDDIEECKKMMLFQGKDVTFMDRHEAAVDLYLMSQMEGNIIANSSFSVWGALLNKKTKRVVCPHDYIGPSAPDVQYINGNYYPGNWIAI